MVVVYRQEVWLTSFNPSGKGTEMHGYRPALIISADEHNSSPGRLVIAVPLTATFRRFPSHIRIDAPEGGLKKTSYARCDQIRTISTSRLTKRIGRISDDSMFQVERALRFLLCL